MNCKWCLREVQQDNGKAFQFCSDQCQLMHPFGDMLDSINQAVDNGANEQEILLSLNRTGQLPQLPEPAPEPMPEPQDGFDR